MTACVDWREHLADHALGLPASAELEAHLARCTTCAVALAGWRAQVEQLDSAVRQLVASEPSPYLRSRVLAKINSQPGWLARVELRRRVPAAVAVVGVLIVLVCAVRGGRERRERVETSSSAAVALSRWQSPTQDLLQSPAAPLFKTVPRLGESFFEMKPEGDESKHEKGRRDAS